MNIATSMHVARAALASILMSSTCSAFAVERWVDNNASIYVAAPGSSCAAPAYTTIQAAVSAALPGDVIRVCPGLYVENVSIQVPKLTVSSTRGAYATIVKAAASAPVFFIRAPLVRLQGFGIRPMGIADGDIGVTVGIKATPARATLLRNVILGGRLGINIGCTSHQNLIAHNLLTRQSEAGINLDTCEIDAASQPGTHDNSVHHNVACSNTSTASIALGGTASDNHLERNVATEISVFGTGNTVQHNTTQLPIIDQGINSVLTDNLVDAVTCS